MVKLGKIEPKKVMAYPKISKDMYAEGETELPYLHHICKQCKKEFLTQLKAEKICPHCNKRNEFLKRIEKEARKNR